MKIKLRNNKACKKKNLSCEMHGFTICPSCNSLASLSESESEKFTGETSNWQFHTRGMGLDRSEPCDAKVTLRTDLSLHP